MIHIFHFSVRAKSADQPFVHTIFLRWHTLCRICHMSWLFNFLSQLNCIA